MSSEATIDPEVIHVCYEVTPEVPGHDKLRPEDPSDSADLNGDASRKYILNTYINDTYGDYLEEEKETDKVKLQYDYTDIKQNALNHAQEPTPRTTCLSLGLSFLMVTFFASGIIIAKLQKSVDVVQILVFRCIVEITLSIIVTLWKKRKSGTQTDGSFNLNYRHFLPALLVGLLRAMSLTIQYISYCLIPMGDAIAIFFCFPIIVMIFSVFVLKEHCGLYRFLLSVVLVVGIVLISKPPFIIESNLSATYGDNYKYGYFTIILGAIFYAIMPIIIKKSKNISPDTVVFLMGIETLIVSTGYLFLFGDPRLPTDSSEWTFCMVSVLLSVLGQFSWTHAIHLGIASHVTAVECFQVVIIYGVQTPLFGDRVAWTDAVGGLLVIIVVVGTSMEEYVYRFTDKFLFSSCRQLSCSCQMK